MVVTTITVPGWVAWVVVLMLLLDCLLQGLRIYQRAVMRGLARKIDKALDQRPQPSGRQP